MDWVRKHFVEKGAYTIWKDPTTNLSRLFIPATLDDNPYLKIALIEKDDVVSNHQTGNNSGVIHSGIYYKPGSLKADFCVEGRQSIADFCIENIESQTTRKQVTEIIEKIIM